VADNLSATVFWLGYNVAQETRNIVPYLEVTMSLTIQTTDLRRRVRDVMERVRLQRETFIVKSYNTPQAVILPYEEYEAYQTWQVVQQKRAAWMGELRRIAEQVSEYAALSDEDTQKLIDEASKR
jgi:prevent-host-death family protein